MSDMQFEHIKDMLSETQEFDYRPEDWQVVFKQLHPPRKRRFFFIFWLSLGGLIAAALIPYVILKKQQPGTLETVKSEMAIPVDEKQRKMNDQISTPVDASRLLLNETVQKPLSQATKSLTKRTFDNSRELTSMI